MVADKTYTVAGYRRVDWSAIFAGLVLAIITQVLLTLLGLSLGLGLAPEAVESGQAGGLGIGAGVWWFITALISLYVGASIAAKMSTSVTRHEGALHGVIMWALSAIVMILLAVTAIGRLISGSVAMVTSGVSAAASGATGTIAESVQQLSGDPQLRDMGQKLMTQGPNAINRDEFVNLMATKGNMSREDAEKRVNDMINAYNQAHQGVAQGMEKAGEAGKTASKAGAAGALSTFVTLLIGMGVSAWAGSRSIRREIDV